MMEIKGRFDHFNFNVLDLKKVSGFMKTLGLKEVRRNRLRRFFYPRLYGRRGRLSPSNRLPLRDRKEPHDLGEGSITFACASRRL
ncbi:MAG: hypothetical protein ACLU30_17480 [Odoribacter splanchnicus]